MFGKDFEKYIEYIQQEYNKAVHAIATAKEYTDELRQTNDSLLTTKQNEIMKTLTVINFIVLPLNLLIGAFGMNTEHTPFVGSPNDFWIVMGLMLFIGLISFAIFKRKKWL
jgi:magnesium transporter